MRCTHDTHTTGLKQACLKKPQPVKVLQRCRPEIRLLGKRGAPQVDQILAMRRDLCDLTERARRLEGEKGALEADIAGLRTQVRGAPAGPRGVRITTPRAAPHMRCCGLRRLPGQALL